jgi:hypothetical protein
LKLNLPSSFLSLSKSTKRYISVAADCVRFSDNRLLYQGVERLRRISGSGHVADSVDFTEELEDFRCGGDAVSMPAALDIIEEDTQDDLSALRQAIIESG